MGVEAGRSVKENRDSSRGKPPKPSPEHSWALDECKPYYSITSTACVVFAIFLRSLANHLPSFDIVSRRDLQEVGGAINIQGDGK